MCGCCPAAGSTEYPISADLVTDCTVFGPRVFSGPCSRATATHLNLQSQKSAVPKLITLISKVLLDDDNRILNLQKIFKFDQNVSGL